MSKGKSSYTAQTHSDHQRYLEMLKAEFVKNYEDANSRKSFCEKSPDDYDQIKAIGSGAYGEVFLVRDKNLLSYHAMKVVDKRVVVERDHVKHLLREKKILQCIDFPFCINLDAAFKDNVYLYFVLPFVSGGEMFNYIQKFGTFSDALAKFYACQVVLALEYLHFCDVIHRDIKPENILITVNGYVKVCDFGFCKIIKKRTWTLCGTPEYLAPEIIVSKGYSFAVDWWALGVLIFEMLAGHPPFFSSDPYKLYENILEGRYTCPQGMNGDCKALLKCLLQVDPTKRIGCLKNGVFDIKTHPWFNEICWSAILYQRADPPFVPTSKSPGDTENFPELIQQKLNIASHCLFEEEFTSF